MWLDKKYIMLLGGSLTGFKQKSDELWVCRCPICGDSKKNKHKTRGYIYNRQGNYMYHCHNCGITHHFKTLLRLVDSSLFDAYMMEKIADEKQMQSFVSTSKVSSTLPKIPYDELKTISQLNPFHVMKKYVVHRQIPTTWHSRLYYCPAFKSFTNQVIPGKFQSVGRDEPRLIIPIRNVNGEDIGFQGRAIGDSNVKYITIMLTDNYPRLFNSDTCDFNHRYYCFEGPIDAMFIPNSMAACGSSLITELDKLNRVKHNAVAVFDNEPRNPEIVKRYEKTIKSGYKICIWPPGLQEKDVNDMILKDVGGEYVNTEKVSKVSAKIKKMIDSCVVRGLEAELQFSKWRKV